MKTVSFLGAMALTLSAATFSLHAQEPATVLYENFTNLTDAPGSLPEGWSRQNSSEEMESLNDGLFVWHAGIDRGNFGGPVEGENYVFIAHASFSDESGKHELEQDEWLIAPEVQLGSDSRISFYVSYVPLFLYNCSNEYLDFSQEPWVFKEKVPATTLKLMARGAGDTEWTEVFNVFDRWADYELGELFNNYSGRKFYKYDLDMKEFDNRKVNFAFRFVGIYGNAMAVDAVRVTTTGGGASVSDISADAKASLSLAGTTLRVGNAGSATVCEVYAVDGREAGRWTLDAEGATLIDLSALAPGIYVAKVADSTLKIAL